MKASTPDSSARYSDANTLFQSASRLDLAGQEQEALPLYERILHDGYQNLHPHDQPRLFVQLGSTLRNLGQLAQARNILHQGEKIFPENRAIKAFLALVEFSDDNPARAAQILLNTLLEDSNPSLQEYERALRWYFDELSTTGKK